MNTPSIDSTTVNTGPPGKPTAPNYRIAERLFEANPGISTEEALIHASDLLRCAAALAYESADHLQGASRDLAFSVVHMVDMAKAMVDRSLDGSGQHTGR